MTEQRHAHQGLPEFHVHGPNHDVNRKAVLLKVTLLTLLLCLLLALGLGRALFNRTANAQVLETRAQASTLLHVLVSQPTTAMNNASARLVLPGTLLGMSESQVYSRVTGYVEKWFKDIGESVKKGEPLAVLEIPEINKQVEEANAGNG